MFIIKAAVSSVPLIPRGVWACLDSVTFYLLPFGIF